MSGTVRFVQSRGDFPCAVRLGDEGKRFGPSFTLSRWGRAGSLRFDPEETEAGSVRADRRRLVYHGRRRSHRFTILDGERFEYDLILNREPETNAVELALGFGGTLDFFRQPDHLPGDLAGSYAVYGREANGPFGTGKLCHIHRPRIIDARGRSVWGELEIRERRLRITIPPAWLAGAAYPVVVDPVIGTQTLGANSYYDWSPDEHPEYLLMECRIPVNRHLAADAVKGDCVARFYTCYNATRDAGGFPAIYEDAGNKPTGKLSADEAFVDLNLPAGTPGAWRAAAFRVPQEIAAGSSIWFGFHAFTCVYPRFDYGALCYCSPQSGEDVYPDPYYPDTSQSWDYKLSMYFEYLSANRYYSYLRSTAGAQDRRAGRVGYTRRRSETGTAADLTSRRQRSGRKLIEQLGADCSALRTADYLRRLGEAFAPGDRANGGFKLFRQAWETERSQDRSARRIVVFVRVLAAVLVRDYVPIRFLRAKGLLKLGSRVARELWLKSRIP